MAPGLTDEEVAAYVASLGLPGLVDLHVHFMPESVQAKVWAHFDRREPPWPIVYRNPEGERLAALRALGVRHHTALAYAHRPGMAAWLNEHTLGLAARHPAVVPSFTIYPEPEVEAYTEAALAAGGAIAKVHVQVGRFAADDPLLDGAWAALERRATPVVVHAGAVEDGSGGEEWCGVEPVRRLLERFAGLRLVVAHLGAPDYEDFVALAQEVPTLRLDTAMVFAGDKLGAFPPHLLDAVADLGERVVFGSDFPTIPHPYAAHVAALAGLGFGDEWLRRVLWRNGVELLGLGEAPDSTST